MFAQESSVKIKLDVLGKERDFLGEKIECAHSWANKISLHQQHNQGCRKNLQWGHSAHILPNSVVCSIGTWQDWTEDKGQAALKGVVIANLHPSQLQEGTLQIPPLFFFASAAVQQFLAKGYSGRGSVQCEQLCWSRRKCLAASCAAWCQLMHSFEFMQCRYLAKPIIDSSPCCVCVCFWLRSHCASRCSPSQGIWIQRDLL